MGTLVSKSPGTDDKRLSQADRKLFYISFLSGLAANIGVVLVVGAAIVLDRYAFWHSHSPPSLWLTLILILVGACAGAICTMAARFIVPFRSPILSFFTGFGAVGFLCLIGYAAGLAR
jgi:hypothetical protein